MRGCGPRRVRHHRRGQRLHRSTAAIAAGRPGVRVLDLAEPGKAKALNAADQVAIGFPRIYLDADIFTTAGVARALCAALRDQPTGTRQALAAVPRRGWS